MSSQTWLRIRSVSVSVSVSVRIHSVSVSAAATAGWYCELQYKCQFFLNFRLKMQRCWRIGIPAGPAVGIVDRRTSEYRNDEFCIRNEELCVKNEELCI